MAQFKDYSIQPTTRGKAIDSKFDQSGITAITNTLSEINDTYDTEQIQREIILSKPALASKIKDYQNNTDVTNPDYIQGYAQLVEEHYQNFGGSTKKGKRLISNSRLESLNAYVTSASKYQNITLQNKDNELVQSHLDNTMNTTTTTGVLPFDAIEDMNKIIDLSANIPNELKPTLKKNATNDILTTEIQTNIRNNDNIEIIRDKLKSYKSYIDPQKYKTLHKQLDISQKQNERALERINTRTIKKFAKKLTGYTNCVTTNNCSPDISNLRETIRDSNVDDEDKRVLIERFDDINELSEIFTEINNDLMGSLGSVGKYIAKNPDDDPNNLRRNNILRKYYNDKRMEFEKDPVQFVISNNKEVKELIEQLGVVDGEEEQEIQSEIRETVTSAIAGHSDRLLTNAEINTISNTEDPVEQITQVKQLIKERGNLVVDELIERNAISKDMKAIGNISDIPVQNRVMTLIRDEKELKQLYSNTSHSFDRTSGVLKSKGFYKDFIEAASANVDMVDEVNSISKLTVLQAMRDGDFSPENLETVFNTMLGDAQVVDSVIVPRSIPEDVAQDRLDNIRDSDFLYKTLKSKDIGVESEDIGFKGGVLSTDIPDEIDTVSRFSDEVESGDIQINVEKGDVVFTKNGKWFKDDLGGLLRIPFDRFTTVEDKGAVDKEMFIMDPHYRNFKILDFLRKL